MNKSIFSINSLSKYSELFQIVGVIGLIASLIFVGMELRQSQQIALVEQQVERTKAFTDLYNTATNNNLAYLHPENDYDKYEVFFYNFQHMFWNISETDYLKYRLGLMDENIWQSRYAIMKRIKSREESTDRNCKMLERVWEAKTRQLDKEFVKLIEDIPSRDCT
jgi:hypothetical protein|tara:strand:- start:526 stop:1020 length:495 start_codon:yes stop_codon:yes gene_type:complete